MSKGLKTIMIAAIAVVVVIGAFLAMRPEPAVETPEMPMIQIASVDENQAVLSEDEMIQNISPSIVSLKSAGENGENSESSGVIMSEDGYIIANNHAVGQNVTVITEDGTEYKATIVGSDFLTDSAVLKIEAEGLQPAIFGDANQAVEGDSVFLLGKAGETNNTEIFTRGSIASILKSGDAENAMAELLEIATEVKPNRMDGVLVNRYGQVIGLNSSSLMAESYEKMSYVSSSSTIREQIRDLIATGQIKPWPRLGISYAKPVSEIESKRYSIPRGILICGVTDESDLIGKDVREGDIIKRIDNVEVKTLIGMYQVLVKYNVGDTVTLTLYRQETGKTFEAKVELIENNLGNQML